MKVYLYVLNTLADWEIAFLTAELHSRRYFKDKTVEIPIVTVGADRNPVRTMGGFMIKPDMTVDELKELQAAEAAVTGGSTDLLMLPGGDTWLEAENSKILRYAAYRIEKGLPVAAICGATVGLAFSDALNNIRHTSNDAAFLKMMCPSYTGEHLYQSVPAYTDGHLITASGLAPLEFTREVLRFLNVFSNRTLDAWYSLYTQRDASSFYELMSSLADK